jgi:hypothetical protein
MFPCRPNADRSSENVRAHLVRHGLFINKRELAIICRSCRFTPGDPTTSVANNLAEKHDAFNSDTV